MKSSPIPLIAALAGYVLVTTALVLSPGLLYVPSLVLLTLALGIVLAASGMRDYKPLSPHGRRLFVHALGWVAVVNFAVFCFFVLGYAYSVGSLQVPLIAGVLVLGGLLASYASHPAVRSWRRMAAVLSSFAFLGAWQIRMSPAPTIDVWQFQQQASRLLLRGKNPYAAEYSVMQDARFYGPSMVKEGRVQTFPYPPLSLLMALPGYLLGDVRWSLLAALLGTAAVIAAIGRKAGAEAATLAELAAVLFLCQPLNLLLLERAWTEPFLTLCLSLCLWAAARRRPAALALALAAVLAVKQHGLLWLVPLGAARRLSWRLLACAALLALAVTLPFLFWDPAALWRGLVLFHLESPVRSDSLSIPAALATYAGWRPPIDLGFVAVLAAGLAVAVWTRRPLAQATLGGTALFLAFFLFSKGAHLNYYWLIESLLAIGIGVSVATEEERA